MNAKPTISVNRFFEADIRVGRIASVELNRGARTPAYVLSIDFGPSLGVRRTSARLTGTYTAAELVGCRVVAVVNLPPKRVAGVRSEVLVLASVEGDGRTVLLQPDRNVPNGTPVA